MIRPASHCACIAALLLVAAGCGPQQPRGFYDSNAPGPSSSSMQDKATAPPATTPSETCRTTRDTMLGKRQTDVKLLARERSKEDEALLRDRISKGKIILVPAGTRIEVDMGTVTVPDSAGGSLVFRRGTILDGDEVNERGLIPMADLEPVR